MRHMIFFNQIDNKVKSYYILIKDFEDLKQDEIVYGYHYKDENFVFIENLHQKIPKTCVKQYIKETNSTVDWEKSLLEKIKNWFK